MRCLVAILNPQADRGRTAQLAASLQQAVSGRLELKLRQTTRRGEAVDLARDAAQDGCDAVVAIGGDGTVHEVVNGLMAAPASQRPPLAVIPAGSGNDFAYALGVDGDLRQSVDVLQRGATRAVDVGHVRATADRERYCINNIGLLLEGQINLASHQFHWPKGSGLYVRACLQTLLRRPPIARLDMLRDGTPSIGESIMLSIGNGPRSGGKFFLLPEARIDDGEFDYLLAAPTNRLRLLWGVASALRGGRPRAAWMERGRFASLAIRSSIPLAAHIDGEPWLRPDEGVRDVAVTVLVGALRVLCPGGDGA